jgi:hypothetical protein
MRPCVQTSIPPKKKKKKTNNNKKNEQPAVPEVSFPVEYTIYYLHRTKPQS